MVFTHFARAERAVRAQRATADVALGGRRVRGACNARDQRRDARRRRYFFEQLARREFAVHECRGDRPMHAELRGDAGLRIEPRGCRARNDIVRLRADDEFDALDLIHAGAEHLMQTQRRADRRVRQAAGRIRLERETVDFEVSAELRERPAGIECPVQVNAIEPVLAGQGLLHAIETGGRHLCREQRVGRRESGLHVLGRRAFARRLVVAAGEAIDDAQRMLDDFAPARR